MTKTGLIATAFCLMCALGLSEARGQTTAGASAREVTASSGRPSSIQVRQQFFNQEQAYLQRALREVQRCLTTSSLNVVLYDPRGNINRVPQTDLVNCGRRLAQLTRQVNSLARRAQSLGQDAQAVALALERAAEEQRRQQTLRALREAGGQ